VLTGFAAPKLNVVTTLSTYADIAKKIGGEKITVSYIVPGDQDAHFVRPKPSYAVLLNKADVFVSTGLDLELWVPSLVDMAKNDRIRSGQPGYVAAYDGIELLDKPDVLSRSEGGLHIYGNPHIITSPLNFKVIAENIAIGLEKNDPANKEFYRKNLKKFRDEIDNRVFGAELVKLMSGKLLTRLALKGNLISFLEAKEFKGEKLIGKLGGWLKEGMIFRGRNIVAYHKNWEYFRRLFGINIIGYVEPKPGIPPSPKHVEELVGEMKKNDVRVLLAASYFSKKRVTEICDKVNAIPVVVPMGTYSSRETSDVFGLVDYWVSSLKKAFQEADGK
jgi:ABC-type Zn uptake system ZnuABC Zn-binding protein ZnuA